MLVEHRTYILQMGATPDYLKLYEQEGLPLQRQYLVNLVGYYVCEVGPLNQIIHLWGFANFEDRVQRRARMAADAGWPRYVQKIRPFIQSQESRLLSPTTFSPTIELRDV